MTSPDPNHFPKSPPPETITRGVRLQHVNVGGTQTFSPNTFSAFQEQYGKYCIHPLPRFLVLHCSGFFFGWIRVIFPMNSRFRGIMWLLSLTHSPEKGFYFHELSWLSLVGSQEVEDDVKLLSKFALRDIEIEITLLFWDSVKRVVPAFQVCLIFAPFCPPSPFASSPHPWSSATGPSMLKIRVSFWSHGSLFFTTLVHLPSSHQ